MSNNLKYIIPIFILSVLIIACGLCSTANKVKTDKHIEYEVTGTSGLVDITISNESGGTEQFSNVTTPWKKSYYIKSGHVYISAQNQRERGTVIVKVYVDGKVLKESSSEGAYVIASVSDWVY